MTRRPDCPPPARILRAHEGRGAGFDAMSDLEIDPEMRCWRWKTDKPGLQEFVRNHFISRREDG